MFRSGKFVAEYIEGFNGESLDKKQIQPNGVDLKVGKIVKHDGVGKIWTHGKEMPSTREAHLVDSQKYGLTPGPYRIAYNEKIKIPDDHIGIVFPRSTVMRMGCMVFTALWDSGYEGIGQGGMWVGNPIDIEKGARVAQMTFVKSEDPEQTYDGQYQGEGLE